LFPRLLCVRQKNPAPMITDIRKEVLLALEKIKVNNLDLSGLTVGITAGSRGIANMPEIQRALVDVVKEAGGHPVIIAAMGTHGGGTAEGQYEVLSSLGITEESVGAPICCCADTVLLGETTNGVPVYCNIEATKVDRLIVVNRIKPHTDFTGEIESGICKMLTIGLGSKQGALTAHSHALIKGFEEVITGVAGFMIKKLPVLFALGILENWKGQTAEIEAILPEDIFEKEKSLLVKAKSSIVKLPFKSLDVLVLGEIGKNISGTGMDTKVVGRIMVKGQKEPEFPKISRIVVLNITPESHGNAIGIGLADITTNNVFKSIDIRATSLNSISSMSPEQGRLPCIVANDREAINSALLTLGAVDENKVRLVYIQNTLKLEEFAVSEAMLEEVRMNEQLEVIGTLEEMRFDADGSLLNFRGGFSHE